MTLWRAVAVMLCIARPLGAEVLVCADPGFVVRDGDAATRAQTCSAASETKALLESCGVSLTRGIEIKIVTSFDTEHRSCLGLYHCGDDRIEILSPANLGLARQKVGAFALISDDAYWASILAHEITHAAYDVVDCPYSTCVTTGEYASYAMQVYALPEDQRSLFGQTIALRSAPTHDAISEIMLYLSPDRFAKLAWLHFQERQSPCDYMRLIMDGQIFFEREPH